MIDLTWLAGPLGLVGLAVALVSWRGNRLQSSRDGRAAPNEGTGRSLHLLLKQSPVIAAIVIVLGALLWQAVALSTALAFLCGAILTLGAGVFAVKAVEEGRLDLTATTVVVDREASRRALTTSFAIGLAVASVGLLGLAVLYFVLVHTPAAFLQSELVDFGNIAGGFALGASLVALLITVVGSTFAGAAGAYGSAAFRGVEIGADSGHREIRHLGATTGSGGTATDLLQSYLCASVAAIVIAGTGNIFSSQRVEAVALPILVGAAGLIASTVVIGVARLMKSANPASGLRTLELVATALFLGLAYVVVAALELEGVDAFTGREYLLSGPFWAILAGSLTGVAIGLVTEFYTSWRPARRVAEGSGRGLGPSILWSVGLGMESLLVPVLLIATAVVVSYYFAGPYGIAIAAVGMLATMGMTVATGAFGPLAASFPATDESPHRGHDRSAALGLSAIGESAEAIARGVSVGAAGMTAIALLTGFTFATGLWGVGIDLQSPLVLVGLLVGATLPIVMAAVLLAGGRRISAGLIAADPPAAGSVRAGSDTLSAPALLPRKMILPTLIAVAVPPLFGYFFGAQSVAGLIAGGAFSSLLLGLFLANSGSTLVNTSIFISANATAPEVHRIGAGSADFGRALRDGCVTAITVMIKLIGVLSIVLVPWFVRIL